MGYEWHWGVDSENVRSVACPYCGAGVGEMCVTESGRTSSSYHGDRLALDTDESDPICRHCRRHQSEHGGSDHETCP